MNLWPTIIATDIVEILGGTEIEDYGSVHVDWTNPTVLERVENCSVQALPGPEITGDREAIVMRVQIFMPGFHAALDGTKRVRWVQTEQVYTIEGDTPYTRDPLELGLDHHVFIGKEVRG